MFGCVDRFGLFGRQVVFGVDVGQLDGIRVNRVHRRKIGITFMHDHRLIFIKGCLCNFRVNFTRNLDFAADFRQLNSVRARLDRVCGRRVHLGHKVHHVIAGKVMLVPKGGWRQCSRSNFNWLLVGRVEVMVVEMVIDVQALMVQRLLQ